jgi:hypothetical protein
MADTAPWECPRCHCLFERPGFGHEPCAGQVPDGVAVFHCPLSACRWTRADDQPPGMLGALAAEAAIQAHLSGHTLVEWVTEVVNLHDVMTSVAAELGEEGRIGRTLLTGALPTNANIARRECIERIGRAIKGDDHD